MSGRLDVSVLVRTRNEARHLGQLLDVVRAQNHPPVEVIVIDSGSTDGTQAIAHRGADRVIEMEPRSFTYGRSLNLGCEVARGTVLALISAHAYPVSNNWLGNLVEPFADPAVAMVYGKQVPHERTRLGEARDFAEVYPRSSMVMPEQPLGNNANSAVRAGLWAENPFSEDLSGLEDIEWARAAQRRGYVVQYAANAAIVHIHDESPSQVYRRFFREGLAFAELFPDSRRTAATAAIRGLADLVRDVRYWRATEASARDLLTIPAYRVPAAVGFHRGGVERERRRIASSRNAVRSPSPSSRAVVIDGPGRHSLTGHDAAAPRPDEVAIRIACVGVCATDVAIADGHQAYYATRTASYPIVPGHEYSGVIEAAGSSADQRLVGTRVVGECLIGCGACARCREGTPWRCPRRAEVGVLRRDGAYATRVVVPASSVHQLPKSLPLVVGALVEPVAVVLKALRKLGPLDGVSAAVIGVGPIGHIFAQVLRAFGARVTAVDPDQERLRLLQRMDFSTAEEPSERVLGSQSVVIEATGVRHLLPVLERHAPPGQRVVLVGVPGEDGAPLPEPAAGATAQLTGSLGSDSEDWPVAIRLLASGRLDLEPLTAALAPIEDYAAAWESVRSRARLKTILTVDPVLARE